MTAGKPSDKPRTEFGKRLKAAREAKGYTQAQMASFFEITQPSYGDWERYEVALRPEQIQKLVEILEVSADYLMGTDT